MARDDPLAALIGRLKEIVSGRGNPRFSNKQLHSLGDIYERYGYGVTRQYLIGKGSRQDRVLVQILDEIERGRVSREIGAYILRKLTPILSYKEGG